MAPGGYVKDRNWRGDHTEVLIVKVFWTLVYIFLCTSCVAQSQFKLLRYNEDYSYLRTDSLKTPYEKFKFTSLNRIMLSMGGEVRYQMQNFVNEDWGDILVRRYTAFYSRFLFHSDLRMSKSIRAFVQLNSTFANGRVTPVRSIDENRLGVHQAFVDVNGTRSLLIRAGRQELLYGSQRLVSVREGPNNRLSFDAAKIIVTKAHVTTDFFYARPVSIKQGVFDDSFNKNLSFWGSYLVIKRVAFLNNIDLYYLGYRRKRAQFNDGVANEMRHSFGARWWGKWNHWDYDFEALYQTGSFGAGVIRAWTASVNANYTFAKMNQPITLGVKSEVISGDQNRNDGKLNTFNPLFPRGAYFGLAALIGPSNLIDFHPSIKIEVKESLTLSLDYDLFWRQTKADGLYGPNTALIYSGENTTALFIGRQIGFNAEYSFNEHLTMEPEFCWFSTGDFLKEASSGKDIFFTAITIQFKY